MHGCPGDQRAVWPVPKVSCIGNLKQTNKTAYCCDCLRNYFNRIQMCYTKIWNRGWRQQVFWYSYSSREKRKMWCWILFRQTQVCSAYFPYTPSARFYVSVKTCADSFGQERNGLAAVSLVELVFRAVELFVEMAIPALMLISRTARVWHAQKPLEHAFSSRLV